MLDRAMHKTLKRRLAIAQNRFNRARLQVPHNPYSNELNGEGIRLLVAASGYARTVRAVAADAREAFERDGSPDDWRRWDAADDDARRWLMSHDEDIRWAEDHYRILHVH